MVVLEFVIQALDEQNILAETIQFIASLILVIAI